MILIRNLSKSVLGKLLFQNFNFTIHRGDRVGIVGPNGAGKSTLLKLISQMEFLDDGEIILEKERVGYLEQAIPLEDFDLTIGEYLLHGKPHEVETVLARVGMNIFTSLLIAQLSGGQKTKLALAKVLLDHPTTLLLDEPTNHLDKDGIIGLENIIQTFPGAVLIVSHDRKLLETCVTQMLEIDPQSHSVNIYQGNFSHYLQSRAAKREKQTELHQVWQKEKKRMEALLKEAQVAAARESAHAPKVESIKKRLQREIYDQEIMKPKEVVKLPKLQLAGDAPAGKLMVRMTRVEKRLGELEIFSDLSLEIRGGERVLLGGPNGSGKTTLVKIITGDILPDRGWVKIGENVKIGYFDQEHATLSGAETVLEHFERNIASHKTNPRGILAAFGFRENEVRKSIQFLSHGEQVRLVLAVMVQVKYDLLILDEPTNHLDLVSREIIENAIKDFQGALLVISHDRYFIEQIGITKSFVIESGKVKKVLG